MKVRNISNKIIGVAGSVLMPDNEIDVEATAAHIPSIEKLVKMGMLTLVEEPAQAPAVEEKAEATETTDETAVKKTRGRKKTAEAETEVA